MTWTQNVLNALETGLWKFVRIIHSANREFPYHDYIKITNSDEANDLNGSYAVGTTILNSQGDQHKRFVAKRTIIVTNDSDVIVRFNHVNNPAISLSSLSELGSSIDTRHRVEFHTNISEVFYTITAEKTLTLYFEGVLPQEARDAE